MTYIYFDISIHSMCNPSTLAGARRERIIMFSLANNQTFGVLTVRTSGSFFNRGQIERLTQVSIKDIVVPVPRRRPGSLSLRVIFASVDMPLQDRSPSPHKESDNTRHATRYAVQSSSFAQSIRMWDMNIQRTNNSTQRIVLHC